MKKMLLIIGLTSLLSGCYIERNICHRKPYTTECQHGFSDFDGYTKEGQTEKQKIIDVKDCGGTISRFGNIFNNLIARVKEESKNDTWYNEVQAREKVIKDFDQCMVNKGYKFYDKIFEQY